jgi:peptidyl-prolyl cis-trans isomerase D
MRAPFVFVALIVKERTMLQTIRDRVSGPVVWGILGFLILIFAIWGIGVQRFMDGGTDPTVAEVGGVKITQSQFRSAYERYYAQLRQLQGDSFNADELHQAQMREAVLKNLVQDLLLKQYARKVGYRIDDAALREYLQVLPYFQDNGHFSAERYRSVLASIGQSPQQFETQQRQQLAIEQMRGAVLNSAFITPLQAQAAWQLEHQSRVFSYVVFDPAKEISAVSVSDDQVKQYYEQHKNDYRTPERVKLAYVELALDQLPKAAPPGADALKLIYDAEKSSLFSTPEERRARHILIAFGADKESAHKKAEALYQQLKAGADFAELARKNSDDPGSKDKGGELGWVKRGMMAPKFEAALFALASPGEISEPVETEFGWHLIQLEALKPAKTLAFDDPEVQKRLLDLWQQRDAARRFQDMASKLDQLSFENPSSLDPVAKALDLPVQTTDWFTRKGGSGIAADPKVIAAAFSPEVLQDGDNSKPLALAPDHLVVVRKADYQAPAQQTLDEVSATIRDLLKNQAAQARAKAAADALLEDLKGGQTFDDALKRRGLTAVAPGAVARDDKKLDPGLLDALFKLPHPSGGKLVYGEARLDNGMIAVVALSAVNAPEPQSSEASAFKEDAARLRDALAGAEFAAYREGIEKRIKVKVEKQAIAGTEIEPGG